MSFDTISFQEFPKFAHHSLASNIVCLLPICLGCKSEIICSKLSSLYEDCSRLLLEQWDIEKGYPQDDIPLKLIQKDLIMQEIAYSIHCGKIGSGKEAKGIEIVPLIQQMLESFGVQEGNAEKIFNKLISRTGIIIVVEKYKDIYSFSHLTFQEFYTAKYLHVNGMNIFQVIEDISAKDVKSLSGWWKEVVLLYSNMKKDTSSIIVDLCNSQSEEPLKDELQIAAQCFTESIRSPHPDIENILFSKLYAIRSLGKVANRENLTNASFKKYLLRFAASDKYYQYALKSFMEGKKQDKELMFLEETLTSFLNSSNRSIQVLASDILLDLWEGHIERLKPTKELLSKTVELSDISMILKALRVIYQRQELINDKEFVDEQIDKSLTLAINEITENVFNIDLLFYRRSIRMADAAPVEFFIIKQILSELTSDRFREQHSLIRSKLTKELHAIFKDIPTQRPSIRDNESYFMGKELTYTVLLQALLKCESEPQRMQSKRQLMDMLMYGTVKQQRLAIHLVSETFSDDPVVVNAIFEKLTSPWSEIRSSAIKALRRLTLNEIQANKLISLLDNSLEKKKWTHGVKNILTEILFGTSVTGSDKIERFQAIGTLCYFNKLEEDKLQSIISNEMDSTEGLEGELVTIKEDLFGKEGEKILREQMQANEKICALWENSYSKILIDKMLNNCVSAKTISKDFANTLLTTREFRIRYFYEAQSKLINIPKIIELLNVDADLVDQNLLENDDFDVADDTFQVLFVN